MRPAVVCQHSMPAVTKAAPLRPSVQMLLGGRLEVRRRRRHQAGSGGEDEGDEGGSGAGGSGVGVEEGEEEGEESEREWLLHVEGSEEEGDAEALRRIAPGECSIS